MHTDRQTTGPGGYATTIVMYLYVMGFDTGDSGYASAVGWVLVLIILSLSLAQVRAFRRSDDAEVIRI